MKQAVIRLVLAGLIVPQLYGQTSAQIEKELERHRANLPFTMPKISVPAFPDKRMNLTDYGAVADGVTMNTKAFASAISACAKAGGGTVVVPFGTWLTGPIKLETNVNLHLERGALIQFSKRIEDYPFIAGFDGKSKKFMITPPLHAFRSRNIAVTGEGVIDGAGEVWRYVKKEKQTARQWKELLASGGVVSSDGKEWWPSKGAMEGEEYINQLEKLGKKLTAEDYARTREFLRPDLVQLVQCDGILLDGVTFQNSPKFHVRPIQSENVIIRNIKVFAPWNAQNADGIDPTSCRNVYVYDCIVDVGDDGICLKPGTIAASQKPGPACENIIVADCKVYRAHGGFVIGSESFGGVNNVVARNLIFIGTDVGIRFKSLRGKGGVVENIFIQDIQMRAIVNEAILFDMYYGGGAPEDETNKDRLQQHGEPVNERTPQFRNISVNNVVCNGAERAVAIIGLPEMPIKNISLSNVSIDSRKGVLIVDAVGVQLNNCRIASASSPVISIVNCKSILVNRGTFPSQSDVFLRVEGGMSDSIRLVGVDVSHAKKVVELGKDVRENAVVLK